MNTKKPNHAEFTALSYRYEMALVDDQGLSVTVTWTTIRKGIYKVTIERDSGAGQKPYSLYNFNIQGRNWPVTITHDLTDGVQVRISESTANPDAFREVASVKNLGIETWVVPMTNPGGDVTVFNSPYYKPADDDEVRFIEFSGRKCSLTVRADRPSLGRRMQAPQTSAAGQFSDSHDGFGDPGNTGGE